MFGPHLQTDLVRLARKGWTTVLRSFFLIAILLGLWVMNQSLGGTIPISQKGEYARRAMLFTYTIFFLQDLLILAFLPVYVASSIAEEKENDTLESLFISHITDKEIVYGKLFGRLIPLAFIVFANIPLAAFMHLWGNVPLPMLFFHFASTLLLLFLGGSVCIWKSAQSSTSFQAISGSYPWLFLGGFGHFILTFIFPAMALSKGLTDWLAFSAPLTVQFPLYLLFSWILLCDSKQRVWQSRLTEKKPLKKSSTSFAMADTSIPAHSKKSRIHPLALPIGEDALFWKEGMKDGTRWSLRGKWIFIALGIVVLAGLVAGIPIRALGETSAIQRTFKYQVGTFAYCFYFLALAAYFLVIIFQTTFAIVGEREQRTLDFLLLIPDDRTHIFVHKWFGPLWRNWPILAISYLGMIFGFCAGVYSLPTLVLMFWAPLPSLFLFSFLAIWLSVFCRRVLFANLFMVTFFGILALMAVMGSVVFRSLYAWYLWAIFGMEFKDLTHVTFAEASQWILLQQGIFLGLALFFAVTSFWKFVYWERK